MKESVKKILKNNSGELIYLGSQYTTPIIGFLINILVMKYVGPDVLGKYQSIILWGTYFSFLQLGVFNGLNRNLSYYRGANKLHELRISTYTGFTFSLIVAFASLIVVIFLFNSQLNDDTDIAKLAFIGLGITAFFQPMIIFLDTLYRTGQDFKKLGKYTLIDNTIYTLNTSLIIVFGYLGFVIQAIIKIFVGFFLRLFGKIKELKFIFSIHFFKEQLTTGFPLMINGYLYTTFFIFDQFYIINKFNSLELGYYNLARLVLFIIPIIPNSLNSVLYPKASIAYGQSGDDNQILKKFFFKAVLINIIIVIPLVIFIYFFIEPFVVHFLPKYIQGIEYAKISVIGGLGFIFIGPSIILGVLKKNYVNFIFLGVLSLSTYGLYFLGIFNFNEIRSLIWFKNILFITYSIVMLFYVYSLVNKKI